MRKKYNTPHRRHVVKTRMTDEEYADFTGRLAAYEISQSEFIRQAIRKATIRPIVTVSPVNDGLLAALSKLTAEYGIPTIVSMNSLMVDGTGMCGCCRLTVGGEVKYACIDGPEFDGHKVDFDEAISRSRMYKEIEDEHTCRLRRSL